MDDMEATNQLIKSCIQEQCNEIEMLQSIFCNAGEMNILDHSVLADMFDFVEGKRSDLSRKLDFTITLPTKVAGQSIELQIELPFTYPTLEEPCLTVRLKSFSWNRTQVENNLKRLICEYIAGDEIDKSTVYIYPIIVWIQESIDELLVSTVSQSTSQKPSESLVESIEMQRLWIYSHHLMSTTKRQNILKLAKEYKLTGFSRPGKPGIICVEGGKDSTDEFWKCVRQWTWQKIQVRITEAKVRPISKCLQFHRFEDFKEVSYGEEGSVLPIEMSELMKFLDSHNCGYVKKELFLLE